MQCLNDDAGFKPERAQAMPFLIGQGIPMNGPDNRPAVKWKVIKLHARYLQPIRNNINSDLI